MGDQDHFEFSYDRKQPVDIINDDWANAYFYFKFNCSQAPALSLDFNTCIYLDIEYQEPLSITKAVEDLHFFKDFFLLFSTRRICFSDARVITKDEQGNKVEIDFLCRDKARPFNAVYNQADVTLQYREIENSFAGMFRNWIDNRDFNSADLALFKEVRYINFPSPVPAFLNMVFALETLHIRFFDHAPFSNDELAPYRQIKKEALQKLDKKIKTKAEQCLSHMNTLSFAERLRELIDTNRQHLKDFIYDEDDFIKRVKNHRNFLAA
ncbi:MAG TPA: HEPN domain-containing protein [Chitinophagaceae bacterium]|nr:HEPN domain-containing protein [Chitinophagaceae bacterium]